jgi:hypothetical protein
MLTQKKTLSALGFSFMLPKKNLSSLKHGSYDKGNNFMCHLCYKLVCFMSLKEDAAQSSNKNQSSQKKSNKNQTI